VRSSWPFAAVWFDLDGTLVDTEPLMARAVTEVMAARGVAIGEADVAATVGRSWAEAHQMLGVDGPLNAWLAEVFSTADQLAAAGEGVQALTGAAELVRRLDRGGVTVGIVTGSTGPELDRALAVLAGGDPLPVRHRVVAGDYRNGKPHPEPYLLAASRAQVDPAACLVFEDSTVGVASARAAGMVVVGTTAANPPEPSPAHQRLDLAHLVVSCLSEVDDPTLEHLGRLLGGGAPETGH